MDKLLIHGGTPLSGTIRIDGAKNAVLPILAAVILANSKVTLTNIPHLHDVVTMLDLLQQMGIQVERTKDADTLLFDANNLQSFVAPYELVRTMRASILVLGPLLARYQRAIVALPGGCAIGSRPVELHIEALRQLGADINVSNGLVSASVQGRLKGANIIFPFISVGATENALMAAVLAEGKTILTNAACEPEVTDLANCLNAMGAKVTGVGTHRLVIQGVKELSGVNYSIVSDRIEAGTYLCAAVASAGSIKMTNILPENLLVVLDKLRDMGAKILTGSNWIQLDMAGKKPQAVSVKTAAFPGFPTDMQAQLMAVNTVAEGTSTITETIFENRFMHVQELRRMGANIHLNGNTATCIGEEKLSGAPVMATDLRASASLVIAGLVAEGQTKIDRIYHLDRGYAHIEKKLEQLGAKVERITHKISSSKNRVVLPDPILKSD